MIYPVRKLVEADFTVAAINAQIVLLNTLYGTNVPPIVTVADGAVTVVGPQINAWFPAILLYVGTQPTNGEAANFGKRDFPAMSVVWAYHTRVGALATARRDSEIAIEALLPIYEGLRGKAFGATLRQIVNVEDPAVSVEVFETKDQAVVRVGGVLRGSLFTRTQGL